MSDKNLHFQCDRCGLCCQHVSFSEIYKHLDRGDGICRYYEEITHRCSIYENRPVICNIEMFYEKFMQQKMSKEKFFELNYDVCQQFKDENESVN